MAPIYGSASKQPLPLPAVYEGTDTGHELDYIPFAKTSKTIFKQVGSLASTLSDDQWLSCSLDDATVPRLSETDREYCARPSPSVGSTYTRKFGGASNHTKNPLSTMPTSPESTSPSQHDLKVEPRLVKANSVESDVEVGPGLQQRMLRRQLPYQLQPQQHRQIFLQKQSRQQHGCSTEFVFEMPPPRLGNRKSRRLRGSGSLNEKYSRMMHEMELLAQDTMLARSSTANLDSSVSINFSNPLLNSGISNHSLGYHDLSVMGNIACGQEISPTSGPAEYYSFQPQKYCEYELQYPSPSKQVQFDEKFFPSTATMMHNSAAGGGAFSVPYFRTSPGSSNYGISPNSCEVDPIYTVPYSSHIRQVPGGEFDDNPDFDSVLLEQGPFSEDCDPCSPCDSAAVSEDCTLEGLKQPLRDIPCSWSERDLATGGQYPPGSQDLYPEGALDDHLMTMCERIRNVGSTMRASAASSVPQFNSPTSFFNGFRRTHDTDKGREQSRLSQGSRLNFYPRSSSPYRLQPVGGDDSKPERREALSLCVENIVPVHIKQEQSNKSSGSASPVINDHSLMMVHAHQKVAGVEPGETTGETTGVKAISNKAESTSVALKDIHGGCGASITLAGDPPPTVAAVIAPAIHETSTSSLVRESHSVCDEVALLSTRCARTDKHGYPFSPATGTTYIERMDADLVRIAGLEQEVEDLI